MNRLKLSTKLLTNISPKSVQSSRNMKCNKSNLSTPKASTEREKIAEIEEQQRIIQVLTEEKDLLYEYKLAITLKLNHLKEILNKKEQELAVKDAELLNCKSNYEAEIALIKEYINLLKNSLGSSPSEIIKQLKYEKERSIMFYKTLMKKQTDCELEHKSLQDFKKMESELEGCKEQLKVMLERNLQQAQDIEWLSQVIIKVNEFKLSEKALEAFNRITQAVDKLELRVANAENQQSSIRSMLSSQKCKIVDEKNAEIRLLTLQEGNKQCNEIITKLTAELEYEKSNKESTFIQIIKENNQAKTEIKGLRIQLAEEIKKNKMLIENETFTIRISELEDEVAELKKRNLQISKDAKKNYEVITKLNEDNARLAQEQAENTRNMKKLQRLSSESSSDTEKAKCLEGVIEKYKAEINELKIEQQFLLEKHKTQVSRRKNVIIQEYNESFNTVIIKKMLKIDRIAGIDILKNMNSRRSSEEKEQLQNISRIEYENLKLLTELKSYLHTAIDPNNGLIEVSIKKTLEVELKDLHKKFEITQELLSQGQAKNSKLQEKLKISNNSIKSLQETLKSSKDTLKKKDEELALAILQLRVSNASLCEVKKSYEENLINFEVNLQSMAKSENQYLDALQKLAEYERLINELEMTISQKQATIESLTEIIEEYKAEIARYSVKSNNLRRSILKISYSLNESFDSHNYSHENTSKSLCNLEEPSLNTSINLQSKQKSLNMLLIQLTALIEQWNPSDEQFKALDIINQIKEECLAGIQISTRALAFEDLYESLIKEFKDLKLITQDLENKLDSANDQLKALELSKKELELRLYVQETSKKSERTEDEIEFDSLSLERQVSRIDGETELLDKLKTLQEENNKLRTELEVYRENYSSLRYSVSEGSVDDKLGSLEELSITWIEAEKKLASMPPLAQKAKKENENILIMDDNDSSSSDGPSANIEFSTEELEFES